jgi:hypothetical protein
MKLIVGAVAACAIVMATSTGSFANCTAGIFKDNDYCVSCAGKTFKVNYCPGGEAGRVTVGRQYPNCTVSFYDRAACRVHGSARAQKRGE